MTDSARLLLCAVAAVALLAGCATPPPQGVERSTAVGPLVTGAGAAQSTPAAAYRLAAGDEVELRVNGRPELTQTQRLAPDGRLTFAPLRSVNALGLGVAELEAVLALAVAELAPGGDSAQGRAVYLLSEGDEVEVRFLQHPGLNQLGRVRPDGRLTLPLVKDVLVAGKTPEEVQAELMQRYGAYLRQPELSVIVRGFNPLTARLRVGNSVVPAAWSGAQLSVTLRGFGVAQVFVAGEVVRPGMLPLRGRMTVLQALIEAGGYKPSGELRNVIVLRKSDAGEALMIRRDLLADLTSATTNDIELQASDIVILPKTQIATVVEAVDQYVYQLIAPLKNSSFSFFYNLRSEPAVTVK